MRYAVIMAGGAGKRLWPLSRLARPKQLLPLIGGKSLLDLAVERLRGLFDMANIYVITNAQYADLVAGAVRDLPPENIVGEPEGRDTANAIALAAQILAARDGDATMAVFTADHVIRPVDAFAQAVRSACDAAEKNPDALLTFGLRPTWPHTGLGYIESGAPVAEGVRRVVAFKEKPDHQTARRYVDSGRHYWNSGMFVWRVESILAALREFLPDSVERLDPVRRAAAAGDDYRPILREVFPTLRRISIDYAVMEKARKVLVVELGCEWLDVGSWPALENVCQVDDFGNVIVAPNVLVLDSARNILVTEEDHLLAVLGMDDCIIVHAPDATLVCRKGDAQRLKELTNCLERKFGDRFL